jgi:hypothetical protein
MAYMGEIDQLGGLKSTLKKIAKKIHPAQPFREVKKWAQPYVNPKTKAQKFVSGGLKQSIKKGFTTVGTVAVAAYTGGAAAGAKAATPAIAQSIISGGAGATGGDPGAIPDELLPEITVTPHDYTPWIIGGAGILLLILRRKSRRH